MPLDTAYQTFTDAAREAQDWFAAEIANLRTGRVRASLVENLAVEHYGARTPLQGLASLSVADARTIVISPWDASAVPAIEKALTNANLGAMPMTDGKVVRLSFPQLNSEMREQIIKTLHRKAEEARVRLRQARDEALSLLKNERQDSDITEDDFYEGKEELDKRIGKANDTIAKTIEAKETEIQTL